MREIAQEVGQKRFNSESVYVSFFPHVYPDTSPHLTLEERENNLKKEVDSPIEMPLKVALGKGADDLGRITECRKITDKKKRQAYKRNHFAAYTVCATFWTRSKQKRLEEKIKHYNGLMVLDFDNVGDLAGLKKILCSLPYVYYAGLSVSGNGLFAIVPLDNDDFDRHELYFRALTQEMAELGIELDESGSDVTRLRYVSYDPDPYFNENCCLYTLPEGFELEQTQPEELEPFQSEEIDSNQRVELYVREWERKKVVLDDYKDWLAVGMSLAGLGEDGRMAFNRVSQFSSKFKQEENDRKFDQLMRDTRAVGLGTFFYICHQYNVVPEEIPFYQTIPFPYEVLPRRVQEIVEQTHAHQNFPIDYIGPCLLFVGCLACGNAAVVEIQGGWIEKPLLYLSIVGGRGTNKTSCFNFALAPIRKKDNEEYEKFVEAKNAYDAEMAKPQKERSTSLEPPMWQQFILTDFTAEVLVRQHKAHPRGLIVFFDELIGFILNFNKYRNGSDEQMWTQLFAGDVMTVNRVGSDPVKIDDTCIGVFGGIQPEILPQFARGKVHNGFVDRWLFAYPEKVPYPKLNDMQVDPATKRNWEQIINRILDIPYNREPRIVPLSPAAKEVYREWYNKLSDQKNNGGNSFAGIATKMDRYCARLALGVEALKFGCGESDLFEVSETSMRSAIALCYYFLACGIKAHKKFANSPVEELTGLQKAVYDELPQSFNTRTGLKIAVENGMPSRTFERWLTSNLFKKISFGVYEKRYK